MDKDRSNDERKLKMIERKTKSKIAIVGLPMVTMLFLLPQFANAQMQPGGGFQLELLSEMMFDAGFENSQAEVNILKSSANLKYSDFSVEYELNSYYWSDIAVIPFGNGIDEPWENLHKLGIGVMHRFPINNSWSVFGRAGLSTSFEKEMDNSWSWMVAGGVVHFLSMNWQFVAGAAYSQKQVDTVLEIIPLAGIHWNRFTRSGFSASVGIPITDITYRFNSDVALRLAATGCSDLYRLENNSSVEPEGYLETFAINAGLHLDVIPWENGKLSVGVQDIFCREMTIHDKDDNEEKSYDIDDSFSIDIRLTQSL